MWWSWWRYEKHVHITIAYSSSLTSELSFLCRSTHDHIIIYQIKSKYFEIYLLFNVFGQRMYISCHYANCLSMLLLCVRSPQMNSLPSIAGSIDVADSLLQGTLHGTPLTLHAALHHNQAWQRLLPVSRVWNRFEDDWTIFSFIKRYNIQKIKQTKRVWNKEVFCWQCIYISNCISKFILR